MRIIHDFLAQHEVERLIAGYRAAQQDGSPKRVVSSKRSYTLAPALMNTALNVRAVMSLGIPNDKMIDFPFNDSFFFGYEVGDFAKLHVDHRSGYRLNALLIEPLAGGSLTVDGAEVPLAPGDAVVFQPDMDIHAVAPVLLGERLIWSVGRARTARETQLGISKGKP